MLTWTPSLALAQTWERTLPLEAADAMDNDGLGASVAIEGDMAAVGAPDKVTEPDIDVFGAVYVYACVNGAWEQTAKLAEDPPYNWGRFGESVALDNGILAVGRPGYGGAVLVFEQLGGAWVQTADLFDPASLSSQLGASVCIDGDTIAAGAGYDADLGVNAGAAYVFEKVGGVWLQAAKLHALDGGVRNYFGCSIAIDGSQLVVGAHAWHSGGAGAAYVFDRVDGAWTQTAKLVAADGLQDDRFGWSVAMDGDTLIVGADGHDGMDSNAGSAYVFEKIGGVWTQTAQLFNDSPDAWWNQFGFSVAIYTDTALVGAWNDGSGTASVFDRHDSVWTRTAKLSSGGTDFGAAVDIVSRRLIVGAPSRSAGGVQYCGAAWVYDLHGGPCPADVNGDGALDFFDVLAFLGQFSAHDPLADLTGDGSFDFFDVQAYLQLFSAGCP